MNKYWLLLVAIAVAIPSLLHAAAEPTPVMRPPADSIDAVSPQSITVKHSKVALPDKPNGKAKIQSSYKTYTIDKFTRITIDGQPATVDKLSKGQNVSVRGQGGGGSDPTQGGVAAEIAVKTK